MSKVAVAALLASWGGRGDPCCPLADPRSVDGPTAHAPGAGRPRQPSVENLAEHINTMLLEALRRAGYEPVIV